MDYEYLYFIIGYFVAGIALFRRELLVQKETSAIILALSVALFLIGIALHFTDWGRRGPSGALLTPLMSLAIYRSCRRVFLARLKREPRDTYMDWSPGMAADRLFNIVFFVLSGWLVMFNAIGMRELVKRGW
jgi:uncharacterized membrane protein